MKKIHSNILSTFFISILLLSCDEEVRPPNIQSLFWECHHNFIWDIMKTQDTLIGEWEWESITCYSHPEEPNVEAYKGLMIEFKKDNTLHVKQNGQITQTSNWKVENGDAHLFQIDADPRVSQLYGRILFCDKRVQFNDGYRDGCNNFFRRKRLKKSNQY